MEKIDEITQDLSRLMGFNIFYPLYSIHTDEIIYFINGKVRIIISRFEFYNNKANMLPFLCMKAAIARLQLRGLI